MVIALFKIGNWVFSVACSKIAQSSAVKAQIGNWKKSLLLETVSLVVISLAMKFFTLILGLILVILEKAWLYSPLESIIINLAPIAE